MISITDEQVSKILERYNVELIDGQGNFLVLDNGEYKMMTLGQLLHGVAED